MRILYLVFFTFLSNLFFGQIPNNLPQVCNFNGHHISVADIENSITDFSKDDSIWEIYNSILKALDLRNAKFTLVNIKGLEMACSFYGRKGERMIAIDRDYYVKHFFKKEFKRAIIVLVLTHEISHHLNGDIHYYFGDTEYKNHVSELSADYLAGKALSSTCNVDFDFIELALPFIIKNVEATYSHPKLMERINFVKGGWLEIKMEGQPEGELVEIEGTSYLKNTLGVNRYKYFTEFRDSTRNGFGVSYYPKNYESKYIGEFKDGVRHGYGTMYQSEDGVKQEGEWNNQNFVAGTVHTAEGANVSGNYINNQLTGFAKITWINGIHIRAFFSADTIRQEKKVEVIYPSGDSYHGYITSNNYKISNGNYKGFWVKRNGQGNYISKNNYILFGNWTDGKLLNEITVRFPNGSKFMGHFMNENGVQNYKGKHYDSIGNFVRDGTFHIKHETLED